MSTATVKKIGSNIAAALLVLMGIANANPASAITFKFNGVFSPDRNFLDDDVAIEGSYTVNDQILAESFEKTGFNETTFGGIDFFEFSLNGTPIFSGQPTRSEIETNVIGFRSDTGAPFVLGAGGTYLGELIFLQLSFLKPATNCLTNECAGGVTIARVEGFIPYQGKYPAYGLATIKPESVSVPEPTTAIALGVAGALMLMRQRKKAI